MLSISHAKTKALVFLFSVRGIAQVGKDPKDDRQVLSHCSSIQFEGERYDEIGQEKVGLLF